MHRGSRVLALIALLTCPVSADQVEEPLVVVTAAERVIEGSMDWSDNVLLAYGEAAAPEGVTSAVQRRLQGFRSAKAVAHRNLLELAGEVRVDAETRVGDVMDASDTVLTRVRKILQRARVVPKSQEETEGAYRLALSITLREDFADAVLPESPLERPAEWPALAPDPAPADMQLPGAGQAVTDTLLPGAIQAAAGAPLPVGDAPFPSLPADTLEASPILIPPLPYTGLLVDARGLGLQPSMAPRLISQDGREVYGPAFIERTYATFMGVVGYDLDMETARTSDRIGGEESNPLIVDAIGVAGRYGSNAVLTREDGRRIAMADLEGEFLGQCRVMLVVGPRPSLPDSTAPDSILLDSLLQDAAGLD